MFSKKWPDSDLFIPVISPCIGSGGGLYGGKMRLLSLQHLLHIGEDGCRSRFTRSSYQNSAPQWRHAWEGGPSVRGEKIVPIITTKKKEGYETVDVAK